ncbi:MAG TPA: DMT family transporter [Exilispira sp.]|nr:DMT family transporter [Exilispira sp.]
MSINLDSLQYAGQIMSIISALTWAIAVIFYKSIPSKIHPVATILYKNLLSLLFFLLSIGIFIGFQLPVITKRNILTIALSAITGITISDALLFYAFQKISATLYSIIVSTYAVFVVIFSILMLHETLNFIQILGIILIVIAVFNSMMNFNNGKKENKGEKGSEKEEKDKRRQTIYGAIAGIISMLSLAFSVVILKPVLMDIDMMWISALRISIGTAGIFVILLFMPSKRQVMNSYTDKSLDKEYRKAAIRSLFWGTFFGMFISTATWLLGMKYIQASIASILNQLSNIFILVFAAIFLKEKLRLNQIVSFILATAGALLTFF